VHGEFPVASCPCDDRNLIFHVRRTDRRAASADFSALLFGGGVRLADDVSVWGPWGSFVLENTSPRPLLFIAVEDGFAPINSLIEHAIAVDAAESITLYWGAANAGGQYLPNQCRAWAEALDEFGYLPLTTDALPAVLAANPALAASDVYLAGAERDVAPILAVLRASGLPPDRLHVEAW
jgi:CDP-4-dehydro-6-deoxyglucose reductase